MKKWKLYVVLLMAGFIASLSEGTGEPVQQQMPPFQVTVHAFSSGANTTGTPCEQATGFQLPGVNQISFSVNLKDFHQYFDDPFTGNRIIEKQIHSYLCFAQTFPSSESLSQLHRLNI